MPHANGTIRDDRVGINLIQKDANISGPARLSGSVGAVVSYRLKNASNGAGRCLAFEPNICSAIGLAIRIIREYGSMRIRLIDPGAVICLCKAWGGGHG